MSFSDSNTTQSQFNTASQKPLFIGGVKFDRRELAYLPEAMVIVSKMVHESIIQVNPDRPELFSEDFWLAVRIVAGKLVDIYRTENGG